MSAINTMFWKTDKCLLNIHDTGEPGETNLLTDNVYYIPLRNSDGDILNNILGTSSMQSNNC